MCSSDLPIVASYAHRVVAMGIGQILADDTPDKVFSQPDVLSKTFLEPPQITQLAQRAKQWGFDQGVLTVNEMMAEFNRLYPH